MYGNNDGELVIKTGIDNSGVFSDAKQFKAAVQGLKGQVDRVWKGISDSSKGYANSVQRSIKAYREFNTEIKNLEASARSLRKQLENPAGRLDKQINDTKIKMYELRAAMNKLGNPLKDTGTYVKYTEMEEKLKGYKKQLQDLNKQQKELASPEYRKSAEWQTMANQYNVVAQKIQQMRDAADDAGGGFKILSRNIGSAAASALRFTGSKILSFLVNFANVVKKAAAACVHLAQNIGGRVLGALRNLAVGAKNAAVQIARMAGRTAVKGLSSISSAAIRAGKALLGLNKHTRRSNNSFKHGFMTILRYAFGIRSLFFLFRRLRRIVSEGMENLAKYDTKVRTALSSLQVATNSLKGAFAGTFASLITAVAPALTSFINLVTRAFNAVGMFIAALTGQEYFMVAKGLSDIGKSAKSSSSSVKELKRQLASFDELNVLNANDSSSGGGGSGSSSEDYKFEKTPIASGIKEFAEKIKEMFDNGEYKEIGKVIAGGINKGIQIVQDYINWDKIGPTVTKIVDAITGTINGLVDGLDWAKLGETVGDGINTVVNTATRWFDGIDWDDLGKKLAAGIDGLVGRVDWGNVGALLSKRISAVLSVIFEAVSNIKWAQLGYALAEGINGLFSLNWDYLQKRLTKSLNSVLAGIDVAVSNIKWGHIANALAVGINGLIDLDWGYVGRLLAKSLNGVFAVIGETIAQIKWGEAGNKLAKGLNELVFGTKWDYLGRSIKKLFNGALDFIENAVKEFKWAQVGHLLAGGINSIIYLNWPHVGTVLGDAFMGALTMLGEAVKKIKWGQIGLDFAKGLNNFLNKINWEYVGQTITRLATGAFDFVQTFFASFDAKRAGEDIRDMLDSIDWSGIASSFWAAARAAFGTLSDFINTLFSPTVKATVIKPGKDTLGQMTQTEADKAAGNYGKALATNLSQAFSGVAVWILDAIKKAFEGIPWDEWGDKIHEFLIGIQWADIADAFWDAIVARATGIGKLIISALFGSDSDIYKGLFPDGKEPTKTTDGSGIAKIGALMVGGKAVVAGIKNTLGKIFGGGGGTSTAASGGFSLLNGLEVGGIVTLGKSIYSNVKQIAADVQEYNEATGKNGIEMFLDGLSSIYGEGGMGFTGHILESINALYGPMGLEGVGDRIGNLLGITNKNVKENTNALEDGNTKPKATLIPYDEWEKEHGKGVQGTKLSDDALIQWGKRLYDMGYSLSDIVKKLELDEDQRHALAAITYGTPQNQTAGYATNFVRAGGLEEGWDRESVETEKKLLAGINKNSDVNESILNEARLLAAWGFSAEDIQQKLGLTDKQMSKLGNAIQANTKAANNAADEQQSWGEAFKQAWDEGRPLTKHEELAMSLGVNLDTLNSSSASVKVDFIPSDPNGKQYQNSGLINYLKKVFAPGTDTQTRVNLVKNGWKTLTEFVGTNQPLQALLGLMKSGWTTLSGFVGTNNPLQALINLAKGNYTDLKTFVGANNPVSALVNLLRDKFTTVSAWISDNYMGGALNKAVGVIRSGFTTVSKLFSDNYMGGALNKPVGVIRSGFTTVSKFINDNYMGGALNKPVGVSRNGFTTISKLFSDNYMGGALNKGVGAIREGFTTIAALFKEKYMGGSVDKGVGIARDGFTSVAGWLLDAFMGGDVTKGVGITNIGFISIAAWLLSAFMGGSVDKGIGLTREGWSWVDAWVMAYGGSPVGQLINLAKNGWDWVDSWAQQYAQTPIQQKVDLVLDKNKIVLRTDAHDVNTWTAEVMARGGFITAGGMASWWRNVPKYASGTTRPHGTMFVAGENGPEVMGHINGRTEILNRSQLAQTMYASIVAGMTGLANAMGMYLAGQMVVCTNAIISAIGGVGMVPYSEPALASGMVVPYDISAQIAKSTADIQGTLDANNEDLIQTIISVAGQIVTAVQGIRTSTVGNGITTQQIINEINRRTYMYGVSPLQGV